MGTPPPDGPFDPSSSDGSSDQSSPDPPWDPNGGGTSSSTSGDSPAPSSFLHHVSRVVDRFDDLLAFVAIPLLASLLQVENVWRTIENSPRGYSINIGFGFPSPLFDLWSFVNPPEAVPDPVSTFPGSEPGHQPFDPGVGTDGAGTGTTVDVPYESVLGPADEVTGELFVWIALAALAYAAITAVLSAIYVGGIDRRLRDRSAAVGACVRRYALRFFGYELVVFGVALVALAILLVVPPLLLLGIPAGIVAMYLFYATPFLFVVADAPLVEAFGRSYRVATDGGAYFWFTLWHVVVVALVSLVLSLVVSAAGLAGFVVGLAVACPVGLVLTAATTSFLRELVENGVGTTASRV